ncbi:hypothetical protein SAMN04488029_2685 [Reichenbachiella faecimaris]|uniref:Metal-dependent hydrolase, beta-lactamase superfamily II n=1 Tax=Reichenbachiella faecimaris TaxID=692418 RepID=A0A1W2GHK3_REIFA|nr:hypothetical protein [Reichenbachiella faecimaris]SMD36051.1 hypothetical protein SAMN04488029_2685 [Reichenbachiella faecimaris]
MAKHRIRFYPIGNADTTLISLSNGKNILWDYAHMKDEEDSDDKRCDLPEELNKVVSDNYDVVTFTHADKDHINRFSEYFFLDHAKKYQNSSRKKIEELWVPASVLLDEQADEEAKILKAEARFRLKQKTGILIFSRPKKMKKWCDDQDEISYEEVKHLFVDAGKLVPGFSLSNDGVEFFSHSPFKSESKEIDRNAEAIVVQATFNDRCSTKLILGSDCTWEVWEDIVDVTKAKGNQSRLEWDIFHISHHCSYKSLSSDKGDDQTAPTDNIKWMYETQSNNGVRLISSSKPIPSKGSDEDEDKQPPHRQAANYYKSVGTDKNGEFLVTMEEPNKSTPKPIEIEIDTSDCSKIIKAIGMSTIGIGSSKPPRAGK